MSVLGNGLTAATHYKDALSVKEAELSVLRRLGASESEMLIVQSNLAMVYGELGDLEKALSMEQDVYSGRSKLLGEGHSRTLLAASNCASSLFRLRRYADSSKSLLPAPRPWRNRSWREL